MTHRETPARRPSLVETAVASAVVCYPGEARGRARAHSIPHCAPIGPETLLRNATPPSVYQLGEWVCSLSLSLYNSWFECPVPSLSSTIQLVLMPIPLPAGQAAQTCRVLVATRTLAGPARAACGPSHAPQGRLSGRQSGAKQRCTLCLHSHQDNCEGKLQKLVPGYCYTKLSSKTHNSGSRGGIPAAPSTTALPPEHRPWPHATAMC